MVFKFFSSSSQRNFRFIPHGRNRRRLRKEKPEHTSPSSPKVFDKVIDLLPGMDLNDPAFQLNLRK